MVLQATDKYLLFSSSYNDEQIGYRDLNSWYSCWACWVLLCVWAGYTRLGSSDALHKHGKSVKKGCPLTCPCSPFSAFSHTPRPCLLRCAGPRCATLHPPPPPPQVHLFIYLVAIMHAVMLCRALPRCAVPCCAPSQVHLFIFLVAIMHVVTAVVFVVLAGVRLRQWRHWQVPDMLRQCGAVFSGAGGLCWVALQGSAWEARIGSCRCIPPVPWVSLLSVRASRHCAGLLLLRALSE